jgi:hypothetical protein
MIRGILAFGVVVLGLAGCSATSSSRPESTASNWTEGTNWQSAEIAPRAADAYTLSAGDPMGTALYQREAPVVSLPMD